MAGREKPRGAPRPNSFKRQIRYDYGTVDVGDVIGASLFFLASAAFAVASRRRSASDFKFELGVIWAAFSDLLSEREHAPVNEAHANKIITRVVFISDTGPRARGRGAWEIPALARVFFLPPLWLSLDAGDRHLTLDFGWS